MADKKQFTFSFDFTFDNDFLKEIAEYIKPFEVHISGLTPCGDGGEWPDVSVSGEYDEVLKLATEYHGEDDMEWVKEMIEEI